MRHDPPAKPGASPDAMESIESLDDELIKLVGYTIVSLKPGDERILDGGEGTILIKQRMTKDTFVAFVIARYMQTTADGKLRGAAIANEDLKYLRVHYTVARRWPKLPQRLEERQIEALAAIRDRLGSQATDWD